MKYADRHALHLPIDTFLRSLAQDQGTNAMCIILSGTGTDGTLGLRAIKAECGTVMVQSPESAKYTGMPESAVGTGLADHVLPPDKLAGQLIKHFNYLKKSSFCTTIVPELAPVPADMQKIFSLVRNHTGHDFSQYKINTICRRIERRMRVQQIDRIADYVTFLNSSTHERELLFKELLIGVTSFFRDSKAFEFLQDKVIPEMFANLTDEQPVRIWVPGCSTGEEAYSLAIILQETMDKLNQYFNIQIFGTDIDTAAVNSSRTGIFPASVAADIPPAWLRRYFIEEDGTLRVKKMIRDMLVFAPQNVIKDPPFTKLNMISCRNLLIYFGAELQKKLLPVFHYSLKPGGILFLGSSETIGQFTDFFTPVEKKWKIFVRQSTVEAIRKSLELPGITALYASQKKNAPITAKSSEEPSAFQLIETVLLNSNASPCAIVNEKGDILYIHGKIGKYLEPAEGKISTNIIDMARPGLKNELKIGINKAAADKQEHRRREVRLLDGAIVHLVNVQIKPLLENPVFRGMFLVVFHVVPAIGIQKSTKTNFRSRITGKDADKKIEELEYELRNNRETLQTAIEELETSNEELKSTNEELQSTNHKTFYGTYRAVSFPVQEGDAHHPSCFEADTFL